MSDHTKGMFEKILLAGVGALAVTAEKSKEMLDDLVKRGEITVEQGKTLNEELKRSVKNTFDGAKTATSEFIENVDKLTKEELGELKARLADLDKKETANPEE